MNVIHLAVIQGVWQDFLRRFSPRTENLGGQTEVATMMILLVSFNLGNASMKTAVLFSLLLPLIIVTGCDDNGSGQKLPDSPFSQTALALANAVNNNDANTLRQILQHGENPNIIFGDGTTVLHGAAAFGKVDCVKVLLEYGAEPNILASQGNPLHYALNSWNCSKSSDCTNIVRMLLEGGTDAKALDSQGNTPLDIAQENNCEECVALIESKLNVQSSNF